MHVSRAKIGDARYKNLAHILANNQIIELDLSLILEDDI